MTTYTKPEITKSYITGSGCPGDNDADQQRRLRKAIHSRSFAMVSTVSAAGFPHAAGIQYSAVDDDRGWVLYFHTMRQSRKARNIDHDGRVAIVVPVRKMPVGPPFTVQFQAEASVLDTADPQIVSLHSEGLLSAITKHGELEEPGSCFVRVRPVGRVHSYGIGVSTLAIVKDPLHHGSRTTGF